jgi:peptide/nickel transport system permease protein
MTANQLDLSPGTIAPRSGLAPGPAPPPPSHWVLMRRRFVQHRLAVFGGLVVLCFYLVAAFADFLSYSEPGKLNAQRILVPPQRIHFWSGGHFSPHVSALRRSRNADTLVLEYRADRSVDIPVVLFAHGYRYRLFGFLPTDVHWIGTRGAPTESSLFLFGSDTLGRDLFSRLMVGTRTSLTIGLVGVCISLVLGVILGAVSGFYGGIVDLVIQRVIEMLRAVPTLPLWLGLAASIPPSWSVTSVYFTITLIVSFVGWTELARELRGRIMSLRHEAFVLAAELCGASPRRIIFVHLIPSCISHIIATASLALPTMIGSETALSFLGLGLRPPAISLGVLLNGAQNIQSVALYPWLIWPAVPTALIVLAFNLLGDGLRDAADPYG